MSVSPVLQAASKTSSRSVKAKPSPPSWGASQSTPKGVPLLCIGNCQESVATSAGSNQARMSLSSEVSPS